MTISKHLMRDRADRYTFIATQIGIGTVIHTYQHPHSPTGNTPATISITSTGIALVKNPDTDMLITMYVLTLKEATNYFDNGILPMVLDGIIRRNMKRKYHLLQNEIKY